MNSASMKEPGLELQSHDAILSAICYSILSPRCYTLGKNVLSTIRKSEIKIEEIRCCFEIKMKMTFKLGLKDTNVLN